MTDLTNYLGYPQWYIDKLKDISERDIAKKWPSAKEEAWRRTQLKRLPLERLYKDAPGPVDESAQKNHAYQIPGPGDKAPRLVPVTQAIELNYPGVEELLGNAMEKADNRFQAELFQRVQRGFYIYLPKDYHTTDPLFLEDRVPRGNEETFCLNLIVLEEGAHAELWERIGQESEQSLVHNRSSLFLLQDGATLSYYRTQNLHGSSCLIDFSSAILGRNSRFNSYQAEGELHFNKSHLTAQMEKTGSQAELKGIYELKGNGFQEIFTQQSHEAAHCISHSNFRGVLQGKSRAVFNGMIKVDPQGKNTDAYLNNKHLLMGDHCRADSIPGLQIETDQVKCSHGSTSGKIQPDQLFYLQSRGFHPDEAKTIITQSFLEELFQDAPAMVKNELETNWGLSWEEYQ